MENSLELVSRIHVSVILKLFISVFVNTASVPIVLKHDTYLIYVEHLTEVSIVNFGETRVDTTLVANELDMKKKCPNNDYWEETGSL